MEDQPEFIAFLEKKKVNWQRFRSEKPQEWLELAQEFEILGKNGFDQRKKFFINNWRLAYPPEVS